MPKEKDHRAAMLRLVDQLVAKAPDDDIKAFAIALRSRIKLPMTDVLEKVPGANITAKARSLGISRPALYGWRDKGRRPKPKEAKQLAEITGLPWQEIAGLPQS